MGLISVDLYIMLNASPCPPAGEEILLVAQWHQSIVALLSVFFGTDPHCGPVHLCVHYLTMLV